MSTFHSLEERVALPTTEILVGDGLCVGVDSTGLFTVYQVDSKDISVVTVLLPEGVSMTPKERNCLLCEAGFIPLLDLDHFRARHLNTDYLSGPHCNGRMEDAGNRITSVFDDPHSTFRSDIDVFLDGEELYWEKVVLGAGTDSRNTFAVLPRTAILS